MDLVGTCPKTFWEEWLEEGDCAGSPETGDLYGWFTMSRLVRKTEPTARFYVVAHGRLRGYSSVVEVGRCWDEFEILRRGNAVAVTIPEPIPGFRGLRKRWWDRSDEIPFPDWKTP